MTTSTYQQMNLSNLSDSEKFTALIEINKDVVEKLQKLNKNALDISPKDLKLKLETIYECFEEMLGWFENKD